MELSGEEERALDGEYGEALRAAYRILVAVGEFLEAKRLIPVASAHVSGVNYANIGDAGLEFLEWFSREARVRVETTVNPCGMDVLEPHEHVPRGFVEKQRRILDSYLRMGCRFSFSCAPYEEFRLPPRGSHVSWAESSASVYANSVLGLWTNRESGLSALAAAVAGKTPEGGMHLEENRRPGYWLVVEAGLEDPVDWALAAYYAAGRTAAYTIGIAARGRPGRSALKQMSAAIGSAGSSSMFVLGDVPSGGSEKERLGGEDLARLRGEMGGRPEPRGSAALLGCPFYGLEELSMLASMVSSKKARGTVLLQVSPGVYAEAKRRGLAARLEASGVTFLRGACYTLSPAEKWLGFSTLYTDSIKAVHYMRKRGVDARLAPLKEIVRAFFT